MLSPLLVVFYYLYLPKKNNLSPISIEVSNNEP